MTLADALADEKASFRKGPTCTMVGILDKLDDGDTAALNTYLADRGITTTMIIRALQSQGHEIRQASLQRHRRGVCACRPA